MKVSKDTHVTISYTMKNDDDSVIDTSDRSGDLALVIGYGQALPGIEEALLGRETGYKESTFLPPEKGYGERRPGAVIPVKRDFFGEEDDLEIGGMVEVRTEQGLQLMTIHGIDGDHVTLDTNHPLAGKTLSFEFEIQAVREARQAELAVLQRSEGCGCGSGSHGDDGGSCCGGHEGESHDESSCCGGNEGHSHGGSSCGCSH